MLEARFTRRALAPAEFLKMPSSPASLSPVTRVKRFRPRYATLRRARSGDRGAPVPESQAWLRVKRSRLFAFSILLSRESRHQTNSLWKRRISGFALAGLPVCWMLALGGCGRQGRARSRTEQRAQPSAPPKPALKNAPPTPIAEKKEELGEESWNPQWDLVVEQALSPEMLSPSICSKRKNILSAICFYE